MDLKSVQLFVDVMKHQSFANVARIRNIDPSSVSRTIRNLEFTLGFRLFQRTTRRLAPTEAGQAYFNQVNQLVEELLVAGEQALELSNQPVGTLRVAACTSFGQKMLVPIIPIMRQKYPKLALELVLSDNQIDIVEQKIDVAVRFGKQPTGELVYSKLAPRLFKVCASPEFVKANKITNDPNCISELECLRFSIAGYRDYWRFRKPGQKEIKVPVSGNLLISHGLTMTASTVASLGIALLPNWLCSDEIASGQLIDLFPEYECAASDFGTSAWLVYPSKDFIPLKLTVFMDCLKKLVPSMIADTN
ncbi:LysR family transcriptional regulator [uncultured Paraglaciecola sp.]|uniref:LysR family transcriptional regulator n=1 Tax=uncultured Paraglaciecola sp. TaxID=1765024 RepID=UPI002637D372|nr:LysR family transcriptional regulator [uncultured Paraglaciecola sp.]